MADSNNLAAKLSTMCYKRYSSFVPAVEKPRSPGPALYNSSNNYSPVLTSSPQYSIAQRFKHRAPTSSYTPGANCYDRSNYIPGKRAPSYSFGSRCTTRMQPLIGRRKNIEM